MFVCALCLLPHAPYPPDLEVLSAPAFYLNTRYCSVSMSVYVQAEVPKRCRDGPPATLPSMCVRVGVRVCVCARACVCIVLFLDLTACFGSIQSSSSLHNFCPLRDGGMCDLALNDDGNMVRRQEKKWRRESHRRHHPLFYVLWSIARAFVLYWSLQFQIGV